jgi:hypothetical protein
MVWSRGHLQCHHLHTRLYPNPPIGSKVIKGFLCTYLRSSNVSHFGMAEATRLKMWHQGQLQWHHLRTKFHENPPIGSKVISGEHRQACDLISLLSFFGSRLKCMCPAQNTSAEQHIATHGLYNFIPTCSHPLSCIGDFKSNEM